MYHPKMDGEGKYQVTEDNGQKFGPIGVETLKRWDREARFDGGTRILDTHSGTEMSLSE